jgi:hypothetical protein
MCRGGLLGRGSWVEFYHQESCASLDQAEAVRSVARRKVARVRCELAGADGNVRGAWPHGITPEAAYQDEDCIRPLVDPVVERREGPRDDTLPLCTAQSSFARA